MSVVLGVNLADDYPVTAVCNGVKGYPEREIFGLKRFNALPARFPQLPYLCGLGRQLYKTENGASPLEDLPRFFAPDTQGAPIRKSVV